MFFLDKCQIVLKDRSDIICNWAHFDTELFCVDYCLAGVINYIMNSLKQYVMLFHEECDALLMSINCLYRCYLHMINYIEYGCMDPLLVCLSTSQIKDITCTLIFFTSTCYKIEWFGVGD